MKLSDLDPNEVQLVGSPSAQIGNGPPKLKLSDLDHSEVEAVEPDADPKQSPVTAAATGMIRGAVPFAAPIAGIGRAAMDAITGTRGPLAGGSMGDLVDDYRDARDSFKGDSEAAAKANPKTALASNIAGGMANPLFKGADSLPKVMGAAGVQALGDSDADLTQGDVRGSAIDAGAGLLGGAIGYGVGKAIPAALKGAGYLGKKFLTTLGPSEEAINARLAGKAQSDASTYPELADKMAGTLKGLKSQISDASQAAAETLSSDPSIPKPYVENALNSAVEKLKVNGKTIGPVDKKIAGFVSDLGEDLNQLGDNLSEKDVKQVIQKLDDNINWDDQSADKLNNVLKSVRNDLDSTLKFQNPEYKKAMIPVAVKMRILENTKKQFNFKNAPGEGLIPTDTTASKIQNSMSENKAMTQKNLGLLERHTGDDYLADAKDYQLAKQFESTGPQGAKRTALGAAIGGLIGHGNPAAIGLGGAVGSTMDRYGGQAVGGLLDGIVKAGNSKALGQFGPAVEAAAKRGPEALAVLGTILGQNPQFQKTLSMLAPK